jgi:uncharacterized protein
MASAGTECGTITFGEIEDMNRATVLNLLREHRDTLAERYGVRTLAVFGSVARDEASEESDVDLLVEFDRPTGLFGMFELQDHLEDLLGCPVDIGTEASLKPRIRSRVLKEAVDVEQINVDPRIVWDTIHNDLPPLKAALEDLLHLYADEAENDSENEAFEP